MENVEAVLNIAYLDINWIWPFGMIAIGCLQLGVFIKPRARRRRRVIVILQIVSGALALFGLVVGGNLGGVCRGLSSLLCWVLVVLIILDILDGRPPKPPKKRKPAPLPAAYPGFTLPAPQPI